MNINNIIKTFLGRPFYGIYLLLFSLSCYVIYESIYHAFNEIIENKVNYFYFMLLITASIVHIVLIYFSMHDIEENMEKWKNEYQDWIGSKKEIFMRWVIVLLLISFADKTTVGVKPEFVGVALMFSLLLWDILSLCFSQNKKVRIIFSLRSIEAKFFISDFAGLFLWIAICTSDKDYILAVTGGTAIIYTGIIIFRIIQLFRNGFQFIVHREIMEETK